MKKQWGQPRSRENVERQIPASYLAKDEATQERRKLTFLLQESAFSEHIPIFCIIDIDLLPEEERAMFQDSSSTFTPHAAIIIGQTIAEPFLFAEQLAQLLSAMAYHDIAIREDRFGKPRMIRARKR